MGRRKCDAIACLSSQVKLRELLKTTGLHAARCRFTATRGRQIYVDTRQNSINSGRPMCRNRRAAEAGRPVTRAIINLRASEADRAGA